MKLAINPPILTQSALYLLIVGLLYTTDHVEWFLSLAVAVRAIRQKKGANFNGSGVLTYSGARVLS